MNENLRNFQEIIRRAKSDTDAERFVRQMLRGAADRAPLEAILELGQCLVDVRKHEMRADA